MGASTHLRAIVIAGVLAAMALGLAFVTFAMNQSSSHAEPKPILPLHARHTITSAVMVPSAPGKTTATTKPAAKPKPKKPVVPLDPRVKAAAHAGLPLPIARQFEDFGLVVVQLTSQDDPVATQTAVEAKDGAREAHVGYFALDVDKNTKTLQAFSKLVGKVPTAPSTYLYTIDGSVLGTLTGFVDRTVVRQAVVNAKAKAIAATPPAEAQPSSSGSA